MKRRDNRRSQKSAHSIEVVVDVFATRPESTTTRVIDLTAGDEQYFETRAVENFDRPRNYVIFTEVKIETHNT